MFKFSSISRDRLINVDERLVKVLNEAIVNSPYDFTIVDGYRTAKKQNELYQKGRTLKGQIVTNCDGYKYISNHQKKIAVDIAIYNPKVQGKLEWGNLNKLRQVVRHIQEIGAKHGLKISWGGDWVNFKDYPHIEISTGGNGSGTF